MAAMLFGLAVMLAALVAAAQAQAQAPASSPDAAIDPTESAAATLEADAAEYARVAGLPPSEALRRLEAQQASVALTDQLADHYRDQLAGIVIEHRPDYRILVVVAGPSAPDVRIATAPLGVPVLLRSGARATRAQVLDAIERHGAAIRAAMPTPPGMGLDPLTGTLLVLARPSDLDGQADEAATASRLTVIAGVPVEVRTWGDMEANLAAEGGGRLVGSDAEEVRHVVCTSGFVVTDGSRTALSTAAHCPDTMSFIDRDGAATPLSLLGAWGARYQDVQIHAAPMPLAPAFRGDTDDRSRAVTSWRNRASTRVGDVVCHRGQRTGYSCALVSFVDFAPPGNLCAGPCPATWVVVAGPQCKGGDSGGPVFLGTVAFGLVKGDSTDHGTCVVYYYMSTDYLPPGWTVAYAHATPDVVRP